MFISFNQFLTPTFTCVAVFWSNENRKLHIDRVTIAHTSTIKTATINKMCTGRRRRALFYTHFVVVVVEPNNGIHTYDDIVPFQFVLSFFLSVSLSLILNNFPCTWQFENSIPRNVFFLRREQCAIKQYKRTKIISHRLKEMYVPLLYVCTCFSLSSGCLPVVNPQWFKS